MLGLMAKPLRYLGRGEEALERMRAALAVLGPDQLSPEVAELNQELGAALALRGQIAESKEPLERALTAAEALQLPATLCAALMSAGFGYGYAGRVEQERGHYRTVIQIAERHELTGLLVTAYSNLAESLAQTDDAEADEINLAGITASRRSGDRSGECYIAGSTVYRKLLTGDWGEIDELAVQILDDDDDEDRDAQYVRQRLVFLEVLRGNIAAATDHLERCGELRASGDFESEAICRAGDAVVALAAGRAEAARDHAAEVLEQTSQLGPTHEAVRVAWPVVIEAALALDSPETAEALIEEVEARPAGYVPPLMLAELFRSRGLLAAARGRHETVEDDLAAAIARYEELGYPYFLARARCDLGEWLIDRGRADEAQTVLQGAAEAFQRLGAAPGLDRATPLLAAGDGYDVEYERTSSSTTTPPTSALPSSSGRA